MPTQTYKELTVWQKSMDLVVKIYKRTEKFPKTEAYGLTSQLRRATVAIPSNIAEGYRRRSPKEYANFLNIAYASGAELETQIEIAKRLQFIALDSWKTTDGLLNEIMRMLNTLIARVRN